MKLSITEENYLKALIRLSLDNQSQKVGTNELAHRLMVKPATVNDMLKKLKEKGLVAYEKYGKITLTDMGRMLSIAVVRKHRLWETFLHKKLMFSWDEIHEIAEQLEHIQSPTLIDRLDSFLGYPQFDPHGDPIPDKNGNFNSISRKSLASARPNTEYTIVAVKDDSEVFLKHVNNTGLHLYDTITLLSVNEHDVSVFINSNQTYSQLDKEFTENIYVVCYNCKNKLPCNDSETCL